VSSHPDLVPTRVEELRAALELPQRADIAPQGGDVPAAVPGFRARCRALARRAAAPVLRPVLVRLTDAVARRMRFAGEYDRLAVEVELLRAELDALVPALSALQTLATGIGLAATGRDALAELQALEVNLELIKGELDAFRIALDDLGRAISPGAGLEGVPARFAELRERVNALDRRTRAASPPSSNAAPASAAAEPVAETDKRLADGPGARAGDGFDYVGFEQRFRGDPADIRATLEERYLPVLARNPPVLDVGCGRGELLAALAERGIECSGVDLDPGMVAEARARGIDAHVGDAIAHLRDSPERLFGTITAIHVVEHLELDRLTAFLELAATRLRPGGVLIAETPNPTALVVLGNSYILDPTHVWPLHPSLLTFLCERAGFRHVELRFFSPAEAYQLPLIEETADTPPWLPTLNDALEQLNRTLFGYQEYAVVATTPPAPPPGDATG
jgi:SAM-dependent methyltransferase